MGRTWDKKSAPLEMSNSNGQPQLMVASPSLHCTSMRLSFVGHTPSTVAILRCDVMNHIPKIVCVIPVFVRTTEQLLGTTPGPTSPGHCSGRPRFSAVKDQEDFLKRSSRTISLGWGWKMQKRVGNLDGYIHFLSHINLDK